MHARMLQHVSVWIKDASANEVAFSHALEWAFRLQLPLRVAAMGHPAEMKIVKGWTEIANLRGVTLELHLAGEKNAEGVEPFLRANSLCVSAGNIDTRIELESQQRSAQVSSACQLICTNDYTPIERVLVFCRDADLRTEYLESAASLCHALETTPIVLILAGSEYEAELKQEYAEGIFHSRRMPADVDYVIDRDPAQAVNRVVSWRRCTHVMMATSSRDSNRLQRELSTTVNVLTVPDAATLDMPRRIRSGDGVLPWSRRHEFNLNTATEPV